MQPLLCTVSTTGLSTYAELFPCHFMGRCRKLSPGVTRCATQPQYQASTCGRVRVIFVHMVPRYSIVVDCEMNRSDTQPVGHPVQFSVQCGLSCEYRISLYDILMCTAVCIVLSQRCPGLEVSFSPGLLSQHLTQHLVTPRRGYERAAAFSSQCPVLRNLHPLSLIDIVTHLCLLVPFYCRATATRSLGLACLAAAISLACLPELSTRFCAAFLAFTEHPCVSQQHTVD